MRGLVVVALVAAGLVGCGAPEPACVDRGTAGDPAWLVYCNNSADWQPGDGAWFPYCSDEQPPESFAIEGPPHEAGCVDGEAVCTRAVFRCVWVDSVGGTRP